MSVDNQKAEQFLSRLLSNPTLFGLSELQKEEQIIQFLNINGSKLYPTLSSPAFYNGKPWPWIYQFLVSQMMEITNRTLMPEIQSILHHQLSYSFMSQLAEHHAPQDAAIKQLEGFITKMLEKPEARRMLTGCFNAIRFKAIDKYLQPILDRQKYINFELRKVQRLKLTEQELKNMIILSLLLRPSAAYFATAMNNGQGVGNGGLIQMVFAERVLQQMVKQMPGIPPALLKSAIHSNVGFEENNKIEATGRLTAIFSTRYFNYKDDIKVDRGAETSDKSWFNISRRNYKFYGFDLDMLVELYNISSEHGW